MNSSLEEMLDTTGVALTIGGYPFTVVDVGVKGNVLWYLLEDSDRWHVERIKALKVHSKNQFTVNLTMDIAAIEDFPELAETIDTAYIASRMTQMRETPEHQLSRDQWVAEL